MAVEECMLNCYKGVGITRACGAMHGVRNRLLRAEKEQFARCAQVTIFSAPPPSRRASRAESKALLKSRWFVL